jgi:hypothetical protein
VTQKWIMRVSIGLAVLSDSQPTHGCLSHNQLLGVTEDAFVREVIFVDPVAQVTSMVSVNLSLSQYVYVLRALSRTRC